MPLTPDAILKDVRSGKFSPVYFLSGEETYYIDQVEEAILMHALAPGEADFNLDILYSKDYNQLSDVLNICQNYPVFANRRVVVLREAQHYKVDVWKQLENYVQSPMESTVLVICHKHKSLDKRTSFAKLVDKHCVLMITDKLKEYQVSGWIRDYIQSKSFRIDQFVADLLADNLGGDLSRIANEVEKLELALEKGATVTQDVVDKYIGISRDFNNIEFLSAIQDGNISKAIRIVDYFRQNPKAGPVPMLIGTLYGFYSKLWLIHQLALETHNLDSAITSVAGNYPVVVQSYKKAARLYPLPKTEKAIELLSEYDVRSKGIGNHETDDAALMTELVYRLIHSIK